MHKQHLYYYLSSYVYFNLRIPSVNPHCLINELCGISIEQAERWDEGNKQEINVYALIMHVIYVHQVQKGSCGYTKYPQEPRSPSFNSLQAGNMSEHAEV
jgi:hypothetical protein